MGSYLIYLLSLDPWPIWVKAFDETFQVLPRAPNMKPSRGSCPKCSRVWRFSTWAADLLIVCVPQPERDPENRLDAIVFRCFLWRKVIFQPSKLGRVYVTLLVGQMKSDHDFIVDHLLGQLYMTIRTTQVTHDYCRCSLNKLTKKPWNLANCLIITWYPFWLVKPC